MSTITDDMVAVIERAILSFVATVNPDGTPNLSPKASLTVRGDKLFFADIASPRTIANLRGNPAIAVNVVDVFSRRGYRFNGIGTVIAPGEPDYDDIAEWVWSVNGKDYPVSAVVRIAVSEALPIVSPAYTFGRGTTEQGLRDAFMAKYGVRSS
jgi:predicted pyridoxine 5'-phosphate oxidase superfamily flavin-nucleotide-binding protein